MSAIYVLWLRELRRYVRSRAQIVASLGQPLLYLVALGFGLGPVFQKAGEGNYVQFVAPGIIAMTVLFSSVFSGMGLLWDRQFGFLKETLVAPVPRIQVMLGKTLGACNGRRDPGFVGGGRLFYRGLSGQRCKDDSYCPRSHVPDRMFVLGLGDSHRLRATEYAGLSADHELSGDADLLPVRSSVSAYQSAQSTKHYHVVGSTGLWSRRPSNYAHRGVSFRTRCRPVGAGSDDRGAAAHRQLFVLQNSGLTMARTAGHDGWRRWYPRTTQSQFRLYQNRYDRSMILSASRERGHARTNRPHAVAYGAGNAASGMARRNLVMEPPRRELRQLLQLGIEKSELSRTLDIDVSLTLTDWPHHVLVRLLKDRFGESQKLG